MNPTAVISAIQRFSTEDGPGIRTTVFFKGCPLRCPWCHNPEGLSRKPQLVFRPTRCIACGACVKVCRVGAPKPGTSDRCVLCGKCAEACPSVAREMTGKTVTPEELVAEVEKDSAFYADGGGVTASGGEATLYSDFLKIFFDALGKKNIHRALDTCGATPRDVFIDLVGRVDLVLFDLKIMDPDRHSKIIGAPVANIIENLRELSRSGKPFWIRFPIVPGLTDDRANLEAVADLLDGMKGLERVDLLPFHQLGKSKWSDFGMTYELPELEAPTYEKVLEVAEYFASRGLPVESARQT